MTKPQDIKQVDVEADDDSVEDDLAILKNMNIDEDFNIWDDFRASIAISQKKRGSVDAVYSNKRGSSGQESSIDIGDSCRSSIDIGDSCSSTRAVVSGVQESKRFNVSELAISEIDVYNDNKGGDKGSNSSDIKSVKGTCPDTPSTLTQGELKDISLWNTRLARDTVYSRYYFPEKWELRELKTIEKFLELEKDTPWLNEPGRETTKQTVGDVFFPGDHDAKSVLLKRGPILFDGVDEREMLLFTHGFLLSRLEFDSLLNLIFTINSENPECLNPKQLRERFNQIDTDESGSLDRCELKELFNSMGVPIGERALGSIMERFDKDVDGTIEFEEFAEVMNELTPKKEMSSTWSLGSLQKTVGGMLKKSMSGPKQHKLDCAYPLSDIERIESINMCSSQNTDFFAHSSWADLVFAIFVKGRDEPLIMVCSKPEHRRAWVDAFKTVCIKSLQLRAENGSRIAKKIRKQVGWEHKLIQSSLFSLVLCKEVSCLKEQLAKDSSDINIDEHDEYGGYTALHYATMVGDIDKAKLLLLNRARVNEHDNDSKTPLDHAVLSENREMIHLLESFGGKTNASDVLFKSAVEEQKRIKSETTSPKTQAKKTIDKAKDAASVISQGMSALRERGERLEKLDNTTSNLNNEAANYADMARQLKEKNKKKAGFLGM